MALPALQFDSLLCDPLRTAHLLDFLARRDAAPLLLFHMEVEQFRRLVGSDAALRAHGTQIAHKYLVRDAPQRLMLTTPTPTLMLEAHVWAVTATACAAGCNVPACPALLGTKARSGAV